MIKVDHVNTVVSSYIKSNRGTFWDHPVDRISFFSRLHVFVLFLFQFIDLDLKISILY